MILHCTKCGDFVERTVAYPPPCCFECKRIRKRDYSRHQTLCRRLKLSPAPSLTTHVILSDEMAKRYEKFFQRNVHNLQEMLSLYEDGWSSVALGRKYGCDHTSILYQVKKHGITQQRLRVGITEQSGLLYYPLPHKNEKGKYDHLIEEPINHGKSYREYVEENNQRHPRSKIKDNLPQNLPMGKVRFPHNAHAKF